MFEDIVLENPEIIYLIYCEIRLLLLFIIITSLKYKFKFWILLKIKIPDVSISCSCLWKSISKLESLFEEFWLSSINSLTVLRFPEENAILSFKLNILSVSIVFWRFSAIFFAWMLISFDISFF